MFESLRFVFMRAEELDFKGPCCSFCSCHQGKHPVLPHHGDEHGQRDVSDLPPTVPGTL